MKTSSFDPLRLSRIGAPVGGIVWLVLLLPLAAWLNLPVESSGETWLIERLLMLAVLCFVPLAASQVAMPDEKSFHFLTLRYALLLQPVGAALVIGSFWLRTGRSAAILTLAWMLTTLLIALFGLWRLWRRWSVTGSILPLEELCIDAGLAYVVVGSGWLFLSRLGLNPMNFSDTIVLLTAVHFHYAGFAAPILTGLAGRKLKIGIARKIYLAAATGIIAGPPLVAAGITLSRTVEVISAVILATSLFLLAMLTMFVIVPTLKPLPRLLLILSSMSVIVTMIFACLYAFGRFAGMETVSIPLMAQVHGISNAFGFVLCGLLAWQMIQSQSTKR
ncbi:MAG: YndJ family protein [Acidobacteria bacterium]|nr:YndJ family protein [Acidobacteriota bacterium]